MGFSGVNKVYRYSLQDAEDNTDHLGWRFGMCAHSCCYGTLTSMLRGVSGGGPSVWSGRRPDFFLGRGFCWCRAARRVKAKRHCSHLALEDLIAPLEEVAVDSIIWDPIPPIQTKRRNVPVISRWGNTRTSLGFCERLQFLSFDKTCRSTAHQGRAVLHEKATFKSRAALVAARDTSKHPGWPLHNKSMLACALISLCWFDESC